MCIGSRATVYTSRTGNSTTALVLPFNTVTLRSSDAAISAASVSKGYSALLVHTSGRGITVHSSYLGALATVS
jgi:hypothetical protein